MAIASAETRTGMSGRGLTSRVEARRLGAGRRIEVLTFCTARFDYQRRGGRADLSSEEAQAEAVVVEPGKGCRRPAKPAASSRGFRPGVRG